MLKMFTLAAALAVTAIAAAQDRKVTTADFAGTWNIEVMSHQIALVIEPAEDNKVTATMMMMGRDTLLKGDLSDRTLTLVGVKTEANGTAPGSADHQHVANTPPSNAKPIVVNAAGRRHAGRRDDDQQRPGEMGWREAEGEEEGLDVFDRHDRLAARGLEGSGSNGGAPVS